MKEKSAAELRNAIVEKKVGIYVIKAVAQRGFFGKKDIRLRAVCKSLQQIHL